MKMILVILTFAVAFCFAQEEVDAEPFTVLDTIFFDQCSCQNDSFEAINSDLLPNPLVLQGNDQFACQEENEITGAPQGPGIVFGLDFVDFGGLTTEIDTSFFRNEAGEAKNYFVRFGFEVPEEDSTLDFTNLFSVPAEDIEYTLDIQRFFNLLNVRVGINGSPITEFISTFDTKFLELTLVVQKIQLDGFDEPPVAEAFFCVRADNVSRNGRTEGSDCAFFFIHQPQPEFRDQSETTEVFIFDKIVDNASPTVVATYVEFGNDFFNAEEVSEIDSITKIFDIGGKKIFVSEPPNVPAFPNVISNEIIITSFEDVELNLSELLFEEAVEGTTFFVENIEILEGVDCAEALCDNPEVIPYSPPENNFEESFIVTIGAEALSCDFDLNVTIKVIVEIEEEDATGVVVGVTVGAVFVVAAVVAGAVFMSKMKGKNLEETQEKEKEESKGNEVGSPAFNPETDI